MRDEKKGDCLCGIVFAVPARYSQRSYSSYSYSYGMDVLAVFQRVIERLEGQDG